MQLNVNDDQQIDDPDEPQVLAALRAMEEGQFVVLSEDDDTYVQATRDGPSVWTLEKRLGSSADHYEADPAPGDLQTILDAFSAYLDGDDRWDREVDWSQVDF